MNMSAEVFDIIIVGGGTAGCVLASRLSENKEIQVLLMEAGRDLTSDPRTNVPSLGSSLLATSANWGFKTTPQASLGSRETVAPAGRLLGGSSAVNGFAFLPNSRANIDAWADLGNPGWDWSSFTKSMSLFSLAKSAKPDGHSPLQLTIPDEDSEWPRVWRETLANLGYPEATDPFSEKIVGSLMGPETIGLDKKRSFSANAYLSDSVQSRSNLTIWSDVLVEKIIFDNSETVIARAIQYSEGQGQQTKTVEARKEIVLSAGAINSPRLLEHSGIGDADRLRRLGIDVLIDNPNVGENLQNHPMCSLSFEAVGEDRFQTIDQLLRKDPDAIAAAQKAYSEGTGPASRSNLNILAQLSLPGSTPLDGNLDSTLPGIGSATDPMGKAQESFVRAVLTSPKEASGCYMTAPGFVSFAGDGTAVPPPVGTSRFFTIAVHLAHPLSRGSVHITSPSRPDSSSGVSIDPNYFSHPLDLEILARHVQLIETIAMTEPLSNHLKSDGQRGPDMPAPGGFADLQTAKDFLLKRAKGAHHWTGSCSMMPRESGGVIDHELRVYGCRNLRVCDASIMPISPRSNIQGVVYAVAEHGAQIMKATM
ncbi:Uu.00g083770.m01.CDS01 [Anthostomella pinea]|uniref:Uu.00g083770.m01.CDS01 n=1 Tax=Anthostomella pinea TaxID=933095 RepID=A0AAI8VLL3_9PEZI|nr:Uu.00g083770.m01.CDS01 [Anthostomella pinea]